MVRPEFPRTIYDSMKPPRVRELPLKPMAPRAFTVGSKEWEPSPPAGAAERAVRAHVEQAWLEAEMSALELLRFELGAAGCALRRAGLHLVAAFGAAMVRARGR
jgi:hypothetical protein